jgi:peptidoglycan/LPS O-acetylase OafA/YrhL
LRLRPEIQALRGIAVALVVVGHYWSPALPGGFVGVDVFFAISGFLITSQLLREIERSRRVSLAGFWARRARRILPAGLSVLLACALATAAFVPETLWPQFLSEIRAATLYVENWHLAARAVDYFAATDGPSPVRHYWSLSVEEQFYLGWPLLLAAAVALGARRRALGALMAVVAAASLAYCVADTAADPVRAYFVTPARVWELAAGGVLACLGAAPGVRLARAASWLGLAAIAAAAWRFDATTAFPGVAAGLPVAGALAVIWAGTPTLLLRSAWLRRLGDISYSVYLWHWPLLVLAPFATGRPVDTITTLTVLMLTILAAWLTKLLIEDPIRSGRLVARRTRWTFACAGVSTLVVLGVTASGGAHLRNDVRASMRASQQLLASHPACFGAAAHDPAKPCANPKLRLSVVPSPIEAHKQRNAPCPVIEHSGLVNVCSFGAPAGRAIATVALVGDSHASHWRAALDRVARARRWAGLSLTHTGCPLSKATKNLPEPQRTQCVRWNGQVVRWFSRHPEVRTVFVSAISGGTGVIAPGRNQLAAQRDGYLRAWRALPASVERIVVIRDTPKVLGDTDSCVQRAIAAHRRAGAACDVPRRAALTEDSAATAARRLRSPRVGVVDLTRFFCDRSACPPVIGGALVYKDQNHMTELYSTSLAPYLGRAIDGIERA